MPRARRHRRIARAAGALLVLAVAGAGWPARSDDAGKFLYQPARVPVGRVFRYVKSGADGRDPEQAALYIAEKDRIETFDFRPHGAGAVRGIAWINWSTCSATRLESWHTPAGGAPVLFASAIVGSDDRSVDVRIPSRKASAERIEIGRRPWHVWGFDLATLNVAMAHFANPRDTVTIGLVDPAFAGEGPGARYRGEVTLRYERDEKRGGEKCRAYSIDGPAFEGRGGMIWSRIRDGFFQEVEIATPCDSGRTDFVLRLERVGSMSAKGWERFMREAER